MIRRRVVAFLGLGFLVLVLGCGGGSKAKSADEAKVDLDSDPIALLPGDGITLGNLDARAFLQSGGLGDDVAHLVDRLVPLGDESGFVPSRDVDRIVMATYGTQG